MKKIVLNLLAIGLIALPLLASAQIGGNPPTVNLNLTQLGNNVASAAWIIFTVIAVLAFIYAGILFLIAGGSAEKIATARMAFMWGVAGVVVGIIAFTIITLVTSFVSTGR